MGREQLTALMHILEAQLELGPDSPAMGTWTIRYDSETRRLYFEKCEFGTYCEERPAVFDLEGNLIDKGGPILLEG